MRHQLTAFFINLWLSFNPRLFFVTFANCLFRNELYVDTMKYKSFPNPKSAIQNPAWRYRTLLNMFTIPALTK